MVKNILIIAVLIPSLLFSQESKKERVVSKGLLRAQGIMSFGRLVDLGETTMFLHGNLEYHVTEVVTARSDIFYFLKSDDENTLNMNHQLFEGASFHIKTKGNFDPYFGFQPGIAWSESKVPTLINNDYTYSANSVNPLISGVIGFNFYATKFFHLFIDGRFIYGNHLSDSQPVSLNEVRISFGLGLNLNGGSIN